MCVACERGGAVMARVEGPPGLALASLAVESRGAYEQMGGRYPARNGTRCWAKCPKCHESCIMNREDDFHVCINGHPF
jgi:hypothetical protein